MDAEKLALSPAQKTPCGTLFDRGVDSTGDGLFKPFLRYLPPAPGVWGAGGNVGDFSSSELLGQAARKPNSET